MGDCLLQLDRRLHCLLTGNQAAGSGGAVHAAAGAGLSLVGCTVAGNDPLGVSSVDAATLTNTLGWGNTSQLALGAGSTVSYSAVTGGHAGTGNVTLGAGDDLFVLALPATLAPIALGDYHLAVKAADPLVNTGSNAAASSTDLDGEARVQGGVVEIGADEVALGQYALTVTLTGTGSGTVSSAPTGIACGGDCSEAYNDGLEVTLTATPDAGSTFAGWSGDADCSDGVVTMSAAVSCQAEFAIVAAIFADGSETGSTTAWSATVP